MFLTVAIRMYVNIIAIGFPLDYCLLQLCFSLVHVIAFSFDVASDLALLVGYVHQEDLNFISES